MQDLVQNSWIGLELSRGRYRVTRLIGEGGMASVFEAHDLNLARSVAIKVPKQDLYFQPGFHARFMREVRALVDLRHPHIVGVLDLGEHNELPFVVLQYLDGKSAEEKRQSCGNRGMLPLSIKTILPWLQNVAEALDFIHRTGFVHRDVKPANVLFDLAGNAYLGDFGIVKSLSTAPGATHTALTTMGQAPMTPPYAAPEMFDDAEIDGRADQYGLGVLAYDMLCGQTPFVSSNVFGYAVKHKTEPPPSLRMLCREIDHGIEAAVLRALSKSPRDRFPTCLAFVSALEDALREGCGNHALPVEPSSKKRNEQATAASRQEPTQPLKKDEQAPFVLPGSLDVQMSASDHSIQPSHGLRRAERSRFPFALFAVAVAIAALLLGILFTDDRKTFTNSIGMKMVFVPAGEFMMGSPLEEGKADETPQHMVQITEAFYMGAYEVTSTQYKKLMWSDDEDGVSWEDAKQFCERLSKLDGRTYRLPTEAEWEYACRVGSRTRYSFGDSARNLDHYAWYAENAREPQKVGEKRPNSRGLYDMHGNVSEWCEDWYAPEYYKIAPKKNSQGPSTGASRVLRGGSWASDAIGCCSASRDARDPSHRDRCIGFRVVCAASEYRGR